MPELPEVETVRRGLEHVLTGRTIAGIDIVGPLGPRAVRRHNPGPDHFVAALGGRTVTGVRRRGKYLWWVLDDGDALLAHLGMSGQFRISTGGYDDIPQRHTRVRFRLAPSDARPAGIHGGAAGVAQTVDFVDQRTFGGMMLVPGGAALPAPIAHLARDPLDPNFDRAATVRRLRGKRTSIKRALLDQTAVSGIGNIYADEALWAARVRYDRATAGLAPRTVGRVLDAADAVMRGALAVGGTSFDALYVNVNGESGYFDRSLHVYGRAGACCERCGGRIRRDAFMNRSSFYCPRCQRAGS